MNRRKFLQLSMIAPVVTLSCKQQKEPIVSKTKRSQVTKTRRHDLDIVGKCEIELISWYKVVKMKVTAYCACKKCCGKYADGITASRHVISIGDKFIAADKKYVFGTKMYIPGYYHTHKGSTSVREYAQVLDRGGAIKGNHIDVYFDTHQEALNWGVQFLDVTIFMLNDKENK